MMNMMAPIAIRVKFNKNHIRDLVELRDTEIPFKAFTLVFLTIFGELRLFSYLVSFDHLWLSSVNLGCDILRPQVRVSEQHPWISVSADQGNFGKTKTHFKEAAYGFMP